MHGDRRLAVGVVMLSGVACARTTQVSTATRLVAVRPGITVLVDDSLALVRGRRLGLITNQTGIDARRESDIDSG